MAREHANIRLDMWGDTDWRSLSHHAQWLYMLLLTLPATNRAGVSDWRPGRLATMSTQTVSRADVEEWGAELAAKHFVLIDDETEEILIRSYVKYDGVLKQPNLAITMSNDWAGVASSRIRAVIAFEVQRMKENRPDLNGWNTEKLATILGAPAIDIRAIDPTADPTGDPKPDPTGKGEAHPRAKGRSTSTATSTATSNDLSLSDKSDGARSTYPEDFAEWWQHYPRKESKGDAAKAWKALKKERVLPVLPELISAARAYAIREPRPEYRKLPAGWLRDHKWTDEAAAATPGGAPEDVRDGFLFRNGRPVIGGPRGMNRQQYQAWQDEQEGSNG